MICGEAPSLAVWGKIDSGASDNSSTGSMPFTLLHLPGTEIPLRISRMEHSLVLAEK